MTRERIATCSRTCVSAWSRSHRDAASSGEPCARSTACWSGEDPRVPRTRRSRTRRSRAGASPRAGRFAITSRIGPISRRTSSGRNRNTEIAVATIASPYQARSVVRNGRGEGRDRKRSAGMRSSRATTTYTTLRIATDNKKLIASSRCNRGCTILDCNRGCNTEPGSVPSTSMSSDRRQWVLLAYRMPKRAFDTPDRGVAQAAAARRRADRRRLGRSAALGQQSRTDGLDCQRCARRRGRGAVVDGRAALRQAGARTRRSPQSRGRGCLPGARRRSRGRGAEQRSGQLGASTTDSNANCATSSDATTSAPPDEIAPSEHSPVSLAPSGSVMQWATRAGCHVDRAACAWLIVRHIDGKPRSCSSTTTTRPTMRPRSTWSASNFHTMATTAPSRRCCASTSSTTPCSGTWPGSFTKPTSPTIATTHPKPLGLDALCRGLTLTLPDHEILDVTNRLFDGLYEYRRRALLLGGDPA